jgi:hypothetical protein
MLTGCTRVLEMSEKYGRWLEQKMKCDWELRIEERVTSSGHIAYIPKGVGGSFEPLTSMRGTATRNLK